MRNAVPPPRPAGWQGPAVAEQLRGPGLGLIRRLDGRSGVESADEGGENMAEATFNAGVVKVRVPGEDLRALGRRLRRQPLYKGPCMLIERAAGLALDSTTAPSVGSRPLLWNAHGGPCQRWYVRSVARGQVKLLSELENLALAAEGTPGEWTPIHLERPSDSRHQLWKLRPTDDGVAFLIESALSAHAFDAGRDPEIEREPALWASHWASWQQWVIARLPLA